MSIFLCKLLSIFACLSQKAALSLTTRVTSSAGVRRLLSSNQPFTLMETVDYGLKGEIDGNLDKSQILLNRLSGGGVFLKNVTIVRDADWEKATIDATVSDEKKESTPVDGFTEEVIPQAFDDVIEIKTLVWEVSCNVQPTTEISSAGVDPFYVVAALPINEKVELGILRDMVYKNSNLPFGYTPAKISMAPREIAESLTGFRSGSIPPIGHEVPMKVYIDSSIDDSLNHMISMGSGILGYSLLMPKDDFFRVAEHSTAGCHIGSFIQSSSRLSSVESQQAAMEARQQRKIERFDRRPEPKDRLKEYRQLGDRMIEKAKLLRTTARKKGRVEDMKKLVNEAVATGEFPQLFKVFAEEGRDKNALHLCAWRGDFESVQLMVNTAKTLYPDLDIVNTVSKGPGNYGKTPIFYALTQCREDVVRYLLEEGANLLFVNNKGQTPCSIAVSHLKEGACNLLFETEKQQLREGGKFVNFRSTNSDKKLYGDLDPRFPIDVDNIGEDDIRGQTRAFETSVQQAQPESIVGGIPTEFSPRSIRPTVRWWIREARSLEAANLMSGTDGLITFTQPRQVTSRRKIDQAQSSHRRSLAPRRDVLPDHIDIDALPPLTLEGVLESRNDKSSNLYATVVDSLDTLKILENEIDACSGFFSDPQQNTDMATDEILVNATWGIDCEWKPGVDCGVDNPVATLQLSTRRKSFLLDLQTLCQDFRSMPSTSTGVEVEVERVLEKLFQSPRLALLGYGVLQDLGKLAASFQHMKCFSNYVAVIDLQAVASIVYSKSNRQNLSSLQKMTAVLFEKRLDKTQQCSDWTIRPLSPAQVQYALLDAAVLPYLLISILQQSSLVERYNGQLFSIHANLLSTIRYTMLKPLQNDYKYSVPMGRIKSACGTPLARQSWPTTHAPPELPKQVPAAHLFQVELPRLTKKERLHLKRTTGPQGTKRPKPIQLHTLSANLGNLPIPGITLGYTKDSCAFRIVGKELINTFPEGTHVGFNRRAGVVETTNAWILFCNFGFSTTRSAVSNGKQVSRFYKGGRQLSFRLNPGTQNGKSSEAAMHCYLSNPDDERTEAKELILFARSGTDSKYIFCGHVACVDMTLTESGASNLMFEILEFDRLMGEGRISSDYEELVASNHASLREAVV